MRSAWKSLEGPDRSGGNVQDATEVAGFIGEFDDERTLRLTVDLDYSAERVWAAIADPAEAAKWFMLVPLERRVGGAVMFRSISRGADTGRRGRVSAYRPPHLLEYVFDEVFDSTLRFEVSAHPGGRSQLVFTQRLSSPRVWAAIPDGTDRTVGPEAAPGWQDFLVESLDAHLQGRRLPTPQEVQDRKQVRTEQCRVILASRFG